MAAVCIAANAQGGREYTIEGRFSQDSLRFTPQKVATVYLSRLADGQLQKVDSAKVENKAFTFRGIAPEHTGAYFITGFDNGEVQLFLEPGNISVGPVNARFPHGTRVSGTPANDTYSRYLRLNEDLMEYSRKNMEQAYAERPETERGDSAFFPYQRAVYHTNNITYKGEVLRFVAQNTKSPVALYVTMYDLYPILETKFLEKEVMAAFHPDVHSHPMYKELLNKLRAANLAVGGEGPDFTAATADGKEMKLSDLRGKYVLLDFWASWCAPCRREFPFVKEALAATEGKDNFVVLSYSIDSKEDDWKNCIRSNALAHKNWLHVSTLKGWDSDAAKLYHVEAVPRTVLIDPQGRVAAFELRGEEMVSRVRQLP